MLELMNCLECPIVASESEITIHVTSVFPTTRQPLHRNVDCGFLMPKHCGGPQLDMLLVLRSCNLERSVAKRYLNRPERNIWAMRHVIAEVSKQLTSSLKPKWIEIDAYDVKRLIFRPLAPSLVNIRMRLHNRTTSLRSARTWVRLLPDTPLLLPGSDRHSARITPGPAADTSASGQCTASSQESCKTHLSGRSDRRTWFRQEHCPRCP